MFTLKSLSEKIGISGYEDAIRFYISEYLSESFSEISTDRIGNLFVKKTGKKEYPTVAIIAHLDEVGFQVMDVNEDGNAKVKPLGNIKTWNAINQKVVTADGQKKGIIICDDADGIKPHEYGRLTLIPTLGKLKTGDVFGYEFEFIETETQYIGKALDNRVSCYILYELIETIRETKNEVTFIFSVQEEIGMRGARVAVAEIEPDIIIDLDVSPIGDNNSLKMGQGIGIKISDSIGVSSTNLVTQIEKIAKDANIQIQREVSDCGTSELIITNEKDVGAERVGISVPCQNMHSPVTRINKKDFELGFQLLKKIIQNGLYINP